MRAHQCAKENYGSVLKDCAEAISLNPKASKAYYRSARALFTLDRYVQAVDCCMRCLEFDPENTGVLSLRDQASKAQSLVEDKIRIKAENKRKEQAERTRLKAALTVSPVANVLI